MSISLCVGERAGFKKPIAIAMRIPILRGEGLTADSETLLEVPHLIR
jgi:hypothetical protein